MIFIHFIHPSFARDTETCTYCLSLLLLCFKVLCLVARYALVIETQRFCTKNKLNKNAYLLVFCLSLRIASRCNFNALLLVNLIKCFCSKAISIWLHFMGRINIRTRVNATCVRASTTCSYNYGLNTYLFHLGVI